MHSSRGVLRRHKRNLAPFTLILILSELYADIYIYTELICVHVYIHLADTFVLIDYIYH